MEKEGHDLNNLFIQYRDYFDDRNDRIERIKRHSRDATILSKKIIFGLLRKGVTVEKKLLEAAKKLEEVKSLFHKVCLELENQDKYQYCFAYKDGVEEFIEAATLYNYIKDKKIASFQHLRSSFFIFKNNLELIITPLDYLLGIGDLTGELMRLALNSVASGDRELCFLIFSIMKDIHHDYSVLSNVHPQVSKKFTVLKQSLRKVEHACYMLTIQQSETPSHMLIDMINENIDPVE